MSYEQDQFPCPKCGFYSTSPESCDACGALISRINNRGTDHSETVPPQDDQHLESRPELAPFDVDEGPSLTKYAVFILVAAVAAFLYFNSQESDSTIDPAPALASSKAPLEISEADKPADIAPAASPELLSSATPTPAPTPSPTPATTEKVLSQVVDLFTGDAPLPTKAAAAPPAPTPAFVTPAPQVASVPAPTPAAQASTSARPERDLSVITIGEEDLKSGSYSTMSQKPAARSVPEPDLPPVAEKEVASVPAPTLKQPDQKLGHVTSIDSSSFRSEVLRHRDSPVLVDFYATWCGPCKRLAPRVAAMAMQHGEDLKVVKMDVDKNEDLRKKYNVDSFPTLVLFRNGREVKRLVGLYDLPDLKSQIEPHL